MRVINFDLSQVDDVCAFGSSIFNLKMTGGSLSQVKTWLLGTSKKPQGIRGRFGRRLGKLVEVLEVLDILKGDGGTSTRLKTAGYSKKVSAKRV
jgi:hypothetical protein